MFQHVTRRAARRASLQGGALPLVVPTTSSLPVVVAVAPGARSVLFVALLLRAALLLTASALCALFCGILLQSHLQDDSLRGLGAWQRDAQGADRHANCCYVAHVDSRSARRRHTRGLAIVARRSWARARRSWAWRVFRWARRCACSDARLAPLVRARRGVGVAMVTRARGGARDIPH